MRNPLRLCMAVVAAIGATALAPMPAHADEPPRVLVLTDGNADAATAQFALHRLEMESRRWNFAIEHGDPADLETLQQSDVVMLLNPEGDIFDDSEQHALRMFVENGGGLVATHAAIEVQPEWDWLRETLGATADGPPPETASQRTLSFTDGSAITDGVEDELELTERWYGFDPGPNDTGRTVLATDEDEAPLAWSSLDQRVFYTAAGGSADTWGERDFLQLIRQAIWWSAGEHDAMVQNTADAAPEWPYVWTFVVFVLAVAGGGSIAVWRLDRRESARAADPGRGEAPATGG